MKYILLIVGIGLGSVYNPFLHTKSDLILTCEVIHELDGKSYGFSGTRIGSMMQMKIKLIHMIQGKPQPNSNERIGMFNFNGNTYSLKELITIENNINNNADAYTPAELESLKKSLNTTLTEVKEYFAVIITPFVEQARGVKEPTKIIMQEWAELFHKETSPLLNWGNTQEGKELDLFMQQANSFERVCIFCSDLIHFLDILIKSCPKGMKQFEEIKQQYYGNR